MQKPMTNGSPDLKNSSANIIPLEAFLEDASVGFRQAVRHALSEEGFDLDETLPNLQLVSHILEAVSALGERGHDGHWDRFAESLRSADRKGVLVDLGLPRRGTSG